MCGVGSLVLRNRFLQHDIAKYGPQPDKLKQAPANLLSLQGAAFFESLVDTEVDIEPVRGVSADQSQSQ